MYDTENGAVMHGLNKEDDYHSVIQSKPDAYDVLPDEPDSTGGSTSGSSGSTGDALQPTMPEPDEADDDVRHVDCPNCAADLGPEHEVVAFVENHGEAYCPECAHRIHVGGQT